MLIYLFILHSKNVEHLVFLMPVPAVEAVAINKHFKKSWNSVVHLFLFSLEKHVLVITDNNIKTNTLF